MRLSRYNSAYDEAGFFTPPPGGGGGGATCSLNCIYRLPAGKCLIILVIRNISPFLTGSQPPLPTPLLANFLIAKMAFVAIIWIATEDDGYPKTK